VHLSGAPTTAAGADATTAAGAEAATAGAACCWLLRLLLLLLLVVVVAGGWVRAHLEGDVVDAERSLHVLELAAGLVHILQAYSSKGQGSKRRSYVSGACCCRM
jgi:hypothetical protein